MHKLQYLLESRSGVCIEIFALKNQELLFGKKIHPDLKLVDIDAPGKIGEMAMIIADVLCVLRQFLRFFANALCLACDSLFKAQFFMTSCYLVVILGVCSIDGVS